MPFVMRSRALDLLKSWKEEPSESVDTARLLSTFGSRLFLFFSFLSSSLSQFIVGIYAYFPREREIVLQIVSTPLANVVSRGNGDFPPQRMFEVGTLI